MKEYKILLVEDLPADAVLIKRELDKALEKCKISIVDHRQAFLDQLLSSKPDLIITNYILPSFDGLSVLSLTQEYSPLTPVIVVSDTINEEPAVESMKAGATDYVIKQHIQRLGKVVIGVIENEVTKQKIKKMGESSVTSEQTYRYMFDSNPQPMFVLDIKSLAFLEVNNAAVEKYGYSRDEFLSLTMKTICPLLDSVLNQAGEEISSQCYSTGRWWHLKKSGEVIRVEISSNTIDFNKRKACYVQVTDITENIKTWETLSASEKKFRTLFENVRDVFFQTDLEGVLYEISPSVDRYLGYSREQLIGNPVSDLYYYMNDRDLLLKALLDTGEVTDFTTRFKTRNDEILYASVNARLIYNSAGKPDLIEGSIRDITDRISELDALRSSGEKYRSLFDSQAAAGLVIDPDTQSIINANNASARLYGFKTEDLIHMKLGETCNISDEDIMALIDKIRTLGRFHYETQYQGKDGSLKDVEVYSSKITVSGKDYLHLIVHDITARKQDVRQYLLLNKAMEYSPVGIMVTDCNGGIEYVNPRFTAITGYNLMELKGKNHWFLYSGKHGGETYHEMWETVMSGKDWIGEFPVKRKNGEYYRESVSISPLMNEKRQITHVVAISEDITDKHKMFEELKAAKQKAEATDKLKSAFLNNISNEVRTPLNGIVGFTEILVSQEFSDENKRNFIDIIRKSSNRLLNTITRYLDISMIVSGNTAVYKKPFHLIPLLEELRDEFLESCKYKGLALTLQCPDALTDIQLNTDPDILRKILTHLLDNAVKFTGKGSIGFGYRTKDNIPGFFVTDTGIGIENENIKTLFDYPVQIEMSSPHGYESSGLGLSIAKGLLTLLGGEITVETKKDKGTTFHFTLPAEVLVNAVVKEETRKKQSLIIPNPVILVAEDDDYNFRFIETVLNKADFKVVRAINGTEAVAICQTNPDVSLVLMDLNMPLMGGLEATRQIKDFLPGLPVIALTAYVSTENEAEAFLSGCEEFISKPVDRSLLLSTVGHTLGNKVN